jgi:hydroxyacylglutathione hydrolase
VTARFARARYGKDNYLYLLVEGPDAALVDPGDPEVALAVAAAHGVVPRWIIHTHGHADHTGGTASLRRRLPVVVLGHGADAGWFPPEQDLAGRAEVRLGAISLAVHEAPGHTPGSVLLEWRGRLLTGDTLFWGGSGNCRNGGDPRRLAESLLGVVARLDGGLEVHPGHDYAEANLPFALEIDPGSAAARRRLEVVRAARRAGQEPPPSTLAEERATNPFLRAATVEAVVALRARRDSWNGGGSQGTTDQRAKPGAEPNQE